MAFQVLLICSNIFWWPANRLQRWLHWRPNWPSLLDIVVSSVDLELMWKFTLDEVADACSVCGYIWRAIFTPLSKLHIGAKERLIWPDQGVCKWLWPGKCLADSLILFMVIYLYTYVRRKPCLTRPSNTHKLLFRNILATWPLNLRADWYCQLLSVSWSFSDN